MNSGSTGEPASKNLFSEAASLSSFNFGHQPQNDLDKEVKKQEASSEEIKPQATVGPCLAKLDPAVAQASQQRFQVSAHAIYNYMSILAFSNRAYFKL